MVSSFLTVILPPGTGDLRHAAWVAWPLAPGPWPLAHRAPMTQRYDVALTVVELAAGDGAVLAVPGLGDSAHWARYQNLV
ncbi:MAG: hypothetical protein QG671_2712 [Actinomycetota bacterium]|nr:hypothetical protein [Actinomycetota bacterium]